MVSSSTDVWNITQNIGKKVGMNTDCNVNMIQSFKTRTFREF